jgi:hypothetical protein
MDAPRQEHSHPELLPTGLIIIARDATGQIITRLTCTHSREVKSAMKLACSVLRLKVGAVRVEVHRSEAPTSNYPSRPLATLSLDDLAGEQAR